MRHSNWLKLSCLLEPLVRHGLWSLFLLWVVFHSRHNVQKFWQALSVSWSVWRKFQPKICLLTWILTTLCGQTGWVLSNIWYLQICSLLPWGEQKCLQASRADLSNLVYWWLHWLWNGKVITVSTFVNTRQNDFVAVMFYATYNQLVNCIEFLTY